MSNKHQENREDFSLLKDALLKDWNIFNVNSSKIYVLIKEICKNKYQENPKLFEEAVGILSLYDKKFKDKFSILKSLTCNEFTRSEEHTSELQSRFDLVCRLLLEKKNKHINTVDERRS